MKLYTPILVLLAAGVLAVTAQAHTVTCNPPGNALFPDAGRGFAMQLKDSTRPWLVATAHAPTIQTPLCGPSAATAAGMAAIAHQRRFYALLAAFPAHPTKAQWQARWKPLLVEAAATDASYLQLVTAILQVDPHYGGMGDPAGLRTHLNADRSWLLRHERTPFGAPVS